MTTMAYDDVGSGSPVLLLHSECCRDRVAHGSAVVQRGELAEPHALREPHVMAGGHLHGQAGLAGTADAGERHERAIAQRGRDPEDLLVAADEAGRAPRQVAASPIRS